MNIWVTKKKNATKAALNLTMNEYAQSNDLQKKLKPVQIGKHYYEKESNDLDRTIKFLTSN